MSDTTVTLFPGGASLAILRRIFFGNDAIELDAGAYAHVSSSAARVQEIINTGQVVYALNTGFGKFSETRIPLAQVGCCSEI